MVQEIRQILFSSEELLAAFQSYARKTAKFLPSGRLISCIPVGQGSESKIKIKIEATYGDSVNEIELSYKGTDVLHPIILFCIENNLMLPRDGKKSFSVSGDKAILTIQLDMDSDLGALEAPMTVEHVRKMAMEKKAT